MGGTVTEMKYRVQGMRSSARFGLHFTRVAIHDFTLGRSLCCTKIGSMNGWSSM